MTPATNTPAAAVRQRILNRADGYASTPGSRRGSWGMGAAVFDADERPQWALSLTGIEQRFTAARRGDSVPLLLRAAHEADHGPATPMTRRLPLSSVHDRSPLTGRGCLPRRHRQGRHRQVDRRSPLPWPSPSPDRAAGAAVRGRGPSGASPDVRRRPAPAPRRSTGSSPRRRQPGGPRATWTQAALLSTSEVLSSSAGPALALERAGAVGFATTIAPGVRDVLLIGKGSEVVQATASGRAAVMSTTPWPSLDARRPAGSSQFLNVNDELAGLARSARIRAQADS